MAKTDKFPRLLNLVMLLLDTRKPLSLDEIARRVGGFPDSPAARHKAFERAKKELRELGIPIVTHQIPGVEQFGYQIDKSDMIIPDLRFSNDEASSLAAASAMVSFGGGEGETALQKLGCVVSGQDATVASIPSHPALFRLFEAMAARKVVLFTYRSKLRNLDVYGISFRWGNWYLLGNERESGLVKTFLVNRIESEVEITGIDSLERPGDFDISSRLPKNRWEIGEGDLVTVRVLVHPDVAPLVSYELGGQGAAEWRPDGSLVVSIKIADSGSFFDWLLSNFDKAVLLEPRPLVAELVAYLNQMLSVPETQVRDSVASQFKQDNPGGGEDVFNALSVGNSPDPISADKADGGRSDLRSATAMYSVLVKILPWLARKKSTTVVEISKTFGITDSEVIRLLEVAACCGLPPYTPDSLLEIIVEDDGTVDSFIDMEIITSPRKLTTLEAMVLATTALVALKVPGIHQDQYLLSALAKLKKSLSKFDVAVSEVDVGMEEPYFLKDLRTAANERRSVEITYFSSSSERVSTRQVDPYQLFTESGRWYLRGFCHLTDEIRHFSLGRIISCELTDGGFDLPESELERIAGGDIPSAFGGAGESVVLAIPAGSGWLVERLVASPRLLAEIQEFEVYGFQSSSTAWLSRVLVRLGPSAFIVFPLHLRQLREDAVRTLLDMYS
ncbi:MAG: WYL domain-containing protein [Actinomycetota bacterium]|nr:WYL domain-containing protein [Actinomycetota bacterium]